MTTTRNPVEVIENVIKKLPVTMGALIKDLKKIQDDSFYRPPEGQVDTWYDLMQTLNAAMPWPPVEDWQKDIYFIVTTKKYEDVQK